MESNQINYLPDGYTDLFNTETRNGYDDYFIWDDIILREKVHPELEYKALSLIEKRLGYIPTKSITILYETDIRLYYHRYLFGDIDLAGLYYRTDELLKVMRKWDLKPDTALFDKPEIYEHYCKNYRPYMQLAYNRISQYLGYNPDSRYSIAAEIWLAQVLAKDTIYLSDSITPYDYRAMTSVKYREIWLNEGEEAANTAPLLARQSIG